MPYMNPFDFVPFHGEPLLRTLNEWLEVDGDENSIVSGHIKLRLKVITYLHLTGEIRVDGQRITLRRFYRRTDAKGNSLPCVPGSSVKGMIRAYLEAFTNGIVSSYNVGSERIAGSNYGAGRYAKSKGNKHIGFLTASYSYDLPTKIFPVTPRYLRDSGQRKYFEFTNVLPAKFAIPSSLDRIDVTSFLLGLTGKPVDKEEEAGAIRGRIRFSDIFFPKESLTQDANHPQALDINDPAAFGSPNPSISNWWYFTPREIRLRRSNIRGTLTDFAEFVGKEFRGRKFYFHQDPEKCIQWYQDKWTHMHNLVPYNVECIRPDEISTPLEITFHNIPKPLLKLFLVALCPSRSVRHKLGALKPFGFGSVEFIVDEVKVEKMGWDRLILLNISGGNILEDRPDLKEWANKNQNRDDRGQEGIVREVELAQLELVDLDSWKWLRFILHCPSNLKQMHRLFVYPPYNQRGNTPEQKGFSQTIRLNNNQMNTGTRNIKIPCSSNLEKISEELYTNNKKLPVDFNIYQRRASNFTSVCEDAGLIGFTH